MLDIASMAANSEIPLGRYCLVVIIDKQNSEK
jgi:hypothetical protein